MVALPDGFYRKLWIMILNHPVIRTPSAKNNKKWKPATARAAAPRACRDVRVKARPYGLSRPCCHNPRKYRSTLSPARPLPFMVCLSVSSKFPFSTLSSRNLFHRHLSAVAGSIPAAAASSRLLGNVAENGHVGGEGSWVTDSRVNH